MARTVVAACASLEGFEVEELGDIRLLVDTAFHALTEIGIGPVDIHLQLSEGAVGVEMSAARRPGRGWDDPSLEPLTMIAAVIAEQRTFEEHDGRLVMRSSIQVRPPG